MNANQLLQTYVKEQDDVAALGFLDLLLNEHAIPIVNAIIGSRFRLSLRCQRPDTQTQTELDAEDMRARVLLDLTTRLQAVRQNPDTSALEDFRAYVAVVTYRAFGRYLSNRYRSRTLIKERILYLLTHREEFALWEAKTRKQCCGFCRWRGQQPSPSSEAKRRRLQQEPEALIPAVLPDTEIANKRLPLLMQKVFTYLDGPVIIEDLISIITALLGTEESRPPVSLSDETVQEETENLRATDAPVSTQAEQHDFLRNLWAEIRQLPAPQCAALLLDMTRADGLAVILQFPLQGIATITDIAGAIGMSLKEFAALWPELPLRDEEIARLMETTPQKVINLRQSARRQLSKRMQPFDP